MFLPELTRTCVCGFVRTQANSRLELVRLSPSAISLPARSGALEESPISSTVR
jgi:hypothetical protein